MSPEAAAAMGAASALPFKLARRQLARFVVAAALFGVAAGGAIVAVLR